MKLRSLFFGFAAAIALSSSAQNFAVQTYKADPTGIPDGWPQLIRPLGETTGPLFSGEALMSSDQLAKAKDSFAAAMEARNASIEQTKVSDARAREDLLRDIRKDLIAAINAWDSLTAAQQKAVVKRIVQLVIAILLGDS